MEDRGIPNFASDPKANLDHGNYDQRLSKQVGRCEVSLYPVCTTTYATLVRFWYCCSSADTSDFTRVVFRNSAHVSSFGDVLPQSALHPFLESLPRLERHHYLRKLMQVTHFDILRGPFCTVTQTFASYAVSRRHKRVLGNKECLGVV